MEAAPPTHEPNTAETAVIMVESIVFLLGPSLAQTPRGLLRSKPDCASEG